MPITFFEAFAVVCTAYFPALYPYRFACIAAFSERLSVFLCSIRAIRRDTKLLEFARFEALPELDTLGSEALGGVSVAPDFMIC